MSEIQDKYILALENFTKSLDAIVKLLQEEQAKKSVDPVIDFLKTPMDNLVEVVKDLNTTTKKGFADIKSDNKQILAKIESIKKEKESGMFQNIEDPKNKNKIVDGIKVVMLIAGGVLALGMAFKIIGKVDFLSVIALSGAIVAMAHSFSKIIEIENLTTGRILFASLALPVMAGSLALSGMILKYFPEFSFSQLLSIALVGGALSVVTYFISKSLDNINKKNFIYLPLVPIIFPIISAAILISSKILSGVETLSFSQILSVGFVGLAIGLATYAITLSLRSLRKVTWKEILAIPVLIPAVAAGIVLSSLILSMFIPVKNPAQLLIGSAVIGLSLLAFVPAIYILGKLDKDTVLDSVLMVIPLSFSIVVSSLIFKLFIPLKNPSNLINSSLAIGLTFLAFAPAVYLLSKFDDDKFKKGIKYVPLLALSILATSLIFSLMPDDPKYPNINWILGSGLSIGVFGLLAYGITFLIKDEKKFTKGLFAIVAISAVILASDYLINKGVYDKYPSFKWSLGVGLSIGIFGVLGVLVGLATSTPNFWLGLIGVVTLSAVILATDFIISQGEYNKYPSINWVKGVGLSIGAFAVVSLLLGSIIMTGIGAAAMAAGALTILVFAGALLAVDYIISKGEYNKYPSINWVKGVGLSIGSFATVALLLGSIIMTGIGAAAMAAGALTILVFAGALLAVDYIISKGKYNKYPSINWVKGVGLSIGSFATVALLLGAVVLTGIGAVALVAGAVAVIVFAGALLAIDYIFEAGKFKKYPSKDWLTGVSNSLNMFKDLFKSDKKLNTGNISLGSIISGGIRTLLNIVGSFASMLAAIPISLAIVGIDSIFDLGKFRNYPTEKWVLGVTKAISMFSEIGGKKNLFSVIGDVFKGSIKNYGIYKIAESIVEIDNVFNKGNFNKYPSLDWVNGITKVLNLYLSNIFSNEQKLKDSKKVDRFVKETLQSMVENINMLNTINWNVKVDFNKYLTNFTESILKYINTSLNIKKVEFEVINDIVDNIIKISNKLDSINWNNSKYPSTEYITNLYGGILKLNEIGSSINDSKPIDGFVDFSISSAKAISETSKILSNGVYNVYPNEEYIISISSLILTISKLVSNNNFDNDKSSEFLKSTLNLVPALGNWNNLLSNVNVSTINSKDFSDNLYNIISGINNIVNEWKPNIEKSTMFSESLKTIIPSINTILSIPKLDNNISDTMSNINGALSILSEGVDNFMYSKDGFIGRKKRSMSEFKLFSDGLFNISNGLHILSSLKPVSIDILSGYKEILFSLNNIVDMQKLDLKIDVINKLANSFLNLADSLNKVNSNLEGFTSLTKGLYLISVIDETRLDAVLNTLDNNRDKLQIINETPDNQVNLLSGLKNAFDSLSENIDVKDKDKNASSNENDESSFYSDITEIKNILYEFRDAINKPSNSGSFR